MAAPIIPWMPHNVPSEIQSELTRRKTNRSYNFVGNQTANWDSNTGDWSVYKGPMTSWIRMCSNSAGSLDEDGNPIKPRFVLHGGKGFYQTYGFSPSLNGTGQQIIGYTPDNIPHTIDNSLITPSGGNYPINVATPEISRIEVVIQKELFRRANVEWVCFSLKQLEYLTRYFLIPGITVMVEWGWNHFNPSSLVAIDDINFMQQIWKNSYPLYTKNILRSKGNYDVIYGIISNFNWSVEGNKFVCSTEVTSKDRLYAGIVKDESLSVKSETDEPEGIFQSIKDFLNKDDTIQNIKTIAESRFPIQEIKNITEKNPTNLIWSEIYKPLITNSSPEVFIMKSPYVHGVFAGRNKDQYNRIGKPDNHDWDYNTISNDAEHLWINMGLVVEILNYFSARPGGRSKPMFYVDIMNSVIGGHPNLISCDSRVLIPNYMAPKFHYGLWGLQQYGENADSDYRKQFISPIEISLSGSLYNKRLSRLFYQGKKTCYRNDLDRIININRYENSGIERIKFSSSNVKLLNSWSFPSKEDSDNLKLPDSPNGLSGNYIEKDRSGLLSNVYISYAAFKNAVEKGSTYTDIYKNILDVLMDSTDGFWDLDIIEAENNMTIIDKRYINSKIISSQGDSVFSFDYFDADSLIKSLKFRPQLSNAQAIRTIFGETNNKKSKYTSFNKNDLLDYKFKDFVIFNEKERQQDDYSSDIAKRSVISAREQTRSLIRKVQQININGDAALQMSFPLFKKVNRGQSQQYEIVKLILPDQQLLRLLLDDGDDDNNSRYCAVQPGIILEMTIMGIGGIRTFQYFLIKNLPEPYGDKNIIFRVTDVHQTLEAGNWDTVIRAQIQPLNGYIKNKLRGPWSERL